MEQTTSDTIKYKELILSSKAILVYFAAPDCNVCKELYPKLETILENYFPLLKHLYINVYKSREFAAQHSVFTVPSILLFYEGKEFFRAVRNINIQRLKDDLSRPYSLIFE